MMVWALLVAAGLAAASFLLAKLRKESRKQELLVERMRQSETYLLIRPMLLACQDKRVERIELRPEAVTVTLFSPPGKKMQLRFEKHGMDPLEPVQLQTLAQLIGIELPEMTDNRRYFFKDHREPMSGGGIMHWYAYMVQPRYKDEVLRSAYDRQ